MEPLKINLVGSLPVVSAGETFVIDSEPDYYHVSGLLRKDIAADYRSIWVRQEHLFHWLKAQIDHCNLSRYREIEFAHATPRTLLRERWGVEIPDWLTEELIDAGKLWEMELPAGCTNAASAILYYSLGPLPDAFPVRLAGSLAEKLSDPLIEAALQGTLLNAAWQALLEQWAAPGSPSWVKKYCKRLRSNPKKLWSDLTVWRLLRGYPDAPLSFALGPVDANFVQAIPADSVSEMSLSQDGRRLAVDQIDLVFTEAAAGTLMRQAFDRLLESLSGELVEELTAIEMLLAKAGFDVTSADIARIGKRFRACPGVSIARLSKLSLYVRPPKPARLGEQSPDAAAWIRWTLEEYLPYRWWQIGRREADEEVECSVAAFTDWYCEEYNLIHSVSRLSAIQTISGWREQILNDGASLILLVDNLPWFFWELLEKALAAAGVRRHESCPRFAPLPTYTSVCKPALIAGHADATGSDYKKMLEFRSQDEWQGRRIEYTMGVDQLARLPVISEPFVVLLNYLACDEALHGDADAAGIAWEEQLALLYQNLAQAVAAFGNRAVGAGKEFGLYVLTDHGSTLILPSEKRAADAQLTKKLFPTEKYRSATLSQTEAQMIPQNLWELGHRFVSSPGGAVHFIPRGHNTVASPGTRAAFCHGGATPEEVLVPSGVFRLYPAAWTAPKIRFVDLKSDKATFYVKRIVPLEIEIQNGNGEPCRLESVTIPPEVAEIREFEPVTALPKSTARTIISLYFNSAAEMLSLPIGFNFRIGQENFDQVVELPVTIKSATSGGIDLKSLFS